MRFCGASAAKQRCSDAMVERSLCRAGCSVPGFWDFYLGRGADIAVFADAFNFRGLVFHFFYGVFGCKSSFSSVYYFFGLFFSMR